VYALALSIGNMTCAIVSSVVNAASSQMIRLAMYPRSKFSLHGNAAIMELLWSWIVVRVFLATP
jgi:hypothetical protein